MTTHPALAFLQSARPAVCGMIHVGALPGTPCATVDTAALTSRAAREAALLQECGVDAVMIENMHDAPYLRGSVGPEVVAAMTAVGLAVRAAAPQAPLGVQVLAGANRESLAVALACGADFIRVEGFVFAHVGDEGLHESCAGDLLRYRRAIGADRIAVLADIKKKHSSHALTADLSLAETARAAEFFRADGLIVTGEATGRAASPADLAAVRQATPLPVAIGSGLDPSNAADYAAADLFIVGSWIKEGGDWRNPPDADRVRRFVKAVHGLRGG